MLLSPHYDLAEFCTSQIAARAGVLLVPPPEVVENLERLCHEVLEPIRLVCERPIIISSGYRNDWLNAAVGGAANSAHLFGLAADIMAPGLVPLGLAGRIGMMAATKTESYGSMLPTLDQCILEFGAWVHVSIAPKGKEPRNEFLTARLVRGGKVYETGLRP